MNTALAQLKPYLGKKKAKLNTFAPILLCKLYRIEKRQIDKISIIRVRYLKAKRPDWYFRVHRRNTDIHFLSLNNKQQLVILDSEKNLYLYDCEFQICLAHQQFNSSYDLNIQCNKDYLYLLTDREIYDEGDEPKDYSPRTNTLYQFDYHEFIVNEQIRVDDDYELVASIPAQKEKLGYWLERNKLYLFCSDYAHGKEYHSGLATIDFNKSKRQGLVSESCFKTQHKYASYRNIPIFISIQYGIGVRPNYINPSIIKPSNNTSASSQEDSRSNSEEYLPYNIEIFDINTGENITLLEVKQLTLFALENSRKGAITELLKSADIFKEYDNIIERINQGENYSKPEYPDRKLRKIFDKFYNTLNNVTFYPNLTTDIKTQLNISPKAIGFILEFNYDEYINVEILASGINITTLSAAQAPLFDQLPSYLTHQQTDQIEDPKHPFIPPEKLISNIIEIPHWDLANAKRALQQYLELIQTDIKALVVGYQINIFIRIGYNRASKQYLGKYDDTQFFGKLAEFGEDIAPDLVELINWFCQYSDSEELYHDEETTFLAYAMQHLLSLGEQYQALYLRYLAGVDMDHDVINSNMCGDILSGDQWTENKLKFVIAMRHLGGQHFSDALFERWPGALEEYVEKHHNPTSLAVILEPAYLYDAEFMDEVLEEYYSELHPDTLLNQAFRLLQKKHATAESPAELLS